MSRIIISHRKSTISFLVLTTLVVAVSIAFGAIRSSANSDDALYTQENKTFLSQLSIAREAANYLQAIKQSGTLSAGFNPSNNGQIKLSPDDFAALSKLDQDGLVPQAVGCSNLSFTATNFSVGGNPYSVTIGDFNGDGRLDLATTNANTETVSVLLGDGAGGFSAATNFPVGGIPLSVAAGDFNGDGRLDLVVANANSSNVSVLLGNGTGGFSAATNFPVGNDPGSVITGDFDGDGRLDLAVANGATNNVSVLLGNGTGGFSAATNFPVGNTPLSVTTGDFNEDGRLDLAVANANSHVVSILLGDGAGGFSAATNFPVGTVPYSVTTGDFNEDGRLDLATANAFSNTVSVLLGDGAGGFSAATNFPVGGIAPFSVTAGDFNGDGRLDLAVANASVFSNTVSVLLGNGAGGFSAATIFPVGNGPRSVTTGDFNGDGRLDLAVANASSTFVSVLLNTCVNNPTPTPTPPPTPTPTPPPTPTPTPPTPTPTPTPIPGGSTLKICKIAGPGVALGTPFTFDVTLANSPSGGIFPPFTVPVTVTAGPAGPQNGNCVIVPTVNGSMSLLGGAFAPGSTVIITERAAGNTIVSSISSTTSILPPFVPGARTTTLSGLNGIIAGVTQVTFTNSDSPPTAQTCTPFTTVTEGDLFPGGIVSFGVSSGPGSVTIDHVNAGTGLQSLTVVGVPVNAAVNIPAFTPGTFNPVIVTFTAINPALPVDFTLRAASTFHAANIRVRCTVL
ncbi:MAG: VCBS repeat-containing protein [Acidobacteriota bacterium]|nr:VCBS repeat-containing protein [Acidobacteriota bacterium]